MILGVNIDHVATLRNVRGGFEPDPLSAAMIVWKGGAEQLVCHLREDRRHIRDKDLRLLREWGKLPLNMEMAMTDEMSRIALDVCPDLVTLVPERREERTTEGGLLLESQTLGRISIFLEKCREKNIKVSLFLAPEPSDIDKAVSLGVDQVELHTGEYSNAPSDQLAQEELGRLMIAADRLKNTGIRLAAGHGLTVRNLPSVLGLPGLLEVNIGHSIIARSIFVGLGQAIQEIRSVLDENGSYRMVRGEFQE